METEALDSWIDLPSRSLESLVLHRYLKPPYGYALGIAVWPGYLAIWYTTVFAAEILELVPFSLSVVVAVGGLLVTSVVSALAMCITSWRVPSKRLREHSVVVSIGLLVAPILFVVYFRPLPGFPNPSVAIAPLGLDVFVEHAVLTTGLLGPMIGFAFLVFPLCVLAFRHHLK